LGVLIDFRAEKLKRAGDHPDRSVRMLARAAASHLADPPR